MSILVACPYFPGLGHSVTQIRADNGTIIDSSGNFTRATIYQGSANLNIGFTMIEDISSIFIGTDTETRLMGSGTVIAIYGCRK